jgi:cytochrome P450
MSRRIVAMAQIPLSIPTPSNVSFRSAIRVLHGVVDQFIEQRRSRKQEHRDLLSMLLEARDPETGEGLNDQQIRDEVITLMVAGHETTATALSWTLYLVSKHPAAQDRIRQEVSEVLGDGVPSLADLAKLRFTTMVLEEAMRLYPPVWGLARDPIKPDVIGGYRVPVGSSVYMQTYITHRRHDVWPRPDEFDPERFEPSRAASRHPFAFLPFGAGQHKCIGAHFAMAEGVLALAMLAREFRMKLVSDWEIEPAPRVTLRPDREILLELTQCPAA